MATTLSVSEDNFATEGVFTISRGSRTEARLLTARLSCDDDTPVWQLAGLPEPQPVMTAPVSTN